LNEYSSKLLENAVNELSRLPGIGKRSALRMALFILKENPVYAANLAQSIVTMRNDIRFCSQCHNISDKEVCEICANPKRNSGLICVVEDTRDVIAIEKTTQFDGHYHVLGGVINPMDGIGPNDLTIANLIKRVGDQSVEEVILALPATVEGDTTNYYIYKMLHLFDVSITSIARGVAIGDELQYADEITLGRSIANRLPFDQNR